MKKNLPVMGLIGLILAIWIPAMLAAAKPPLRPQPVVVRAFVQPDELAAAADAAQSLVHTVEFVGCGPTHIQFNRPISGIVFIKTAGTQVCCELSGRGGYYCASEELDGLQAASWGLGVGPAPRILECEIDGGNVVSYSSYTVE